MKCDTCGQVLVTKQSWKTYHTKTKSNFRRLGEIVAVMDEVMGIDAEQLRVRRRTLIYTQPRVIYSKLATEFTNLTYTTIGRFIDRDHKTIMSAEKTPLIAEYNDYYHEIREKLERVTSSLRQAS